MQAEFGLEFPLVQAFADDVPLPDASFDLAYSGYGASLFADPYRWIPEAHRLLRPGGRLVFIRGGPLVILCAGAAG
jgi:ubiquinone/menaquinone biosynthesis C-methylase UbiE